MSPLPHGLWPTMLTPFQNDLTIDWPALDALVDWYLQSGAAGLFAVCLSSELYALTASERLALARRVVQRAAGRVPVIAAGAFGNTPCEQAEAVRSLADTGVAAVVLTTNQLAPGEPPARWREHLAELLAATAPLPLGLYECPAPRPRLLATDELAWAAGTGRFLFLKDTCCDLARIRERLAAIAGTPLRLYNAHAATLHATLAAGAHGFSGIAANACPELLTRLCQQPPDGPDLQRWLDWVQDQLEPGYPASAKYLLGRLGLPVGPASRAPGVPLSAAARTRLDLLATALTTRRTCAPLALPAPSAKVPGAIIAHVPASSRQYVGSPSLAILPDGRYVASHDFFGPGSTENQSAVTRVFDSCDRGETWKPLSELDGCFWASLFGRHNELYLLGTRKQYGDIVIRRSRDGGRTWTTPTGPTDGVLAAGPYHCAPVPVLAHAGRLWRAFELNEGTRMGPWCCNFQALVLSAPATADLLAAASWTLSNALPFPAAAAAGTGWLEGNTVAAPDGTVQNLLRVHNACQAAVTRLGPDGRTLTLAAAAFVPFPGGAKKFSIRRHPPTGLYLALSNPVLPGFADRDNAAIRNTLALVSSPDLARWRLNALLLFHPDAARHAFQYPDWQFDGDDLAVVLRTAFDDDAGGAHNAHDANYLSFLRVPHFARLLP